MFLKVDVEALIGVVELWRPGTPENRGFWLGRKYWDRGLMTEAVVPVMNYAFDTLDFDKLVFTNAVGNDRSRRIKEKTGALVVRTEPAAFVDPTFVERELWELTRSRWQEYQKRFMVCS